MCEDKFNIFQTYYNFYSNVLDFKRLVEYFVTFSNFVNVNYNRSKE